MNVCRLGCSPQDRHAATILLPLPRATPGGRSEVRQMNKWSRPVLAMLICIGCRALFQLFYLQSGQRSQAALVLMGAACAP